MEAAEAAARAHAEAMTVARAHAVEAAEASARAHAAGMPRQQRRQAARMPRRWRRRCYMHSRRRQRWRRGWRQRRTMPWRRRGWSVRLLRCPLRRERRPDSLTVVVAMRAYES